MKKILLPIFFFYGILLSFSQERIRYKELSERTLAYYQQAKDCWNDSEDSCIPFYKKMLESAIKNKECVPCAELELAKGYFNEYEADSSIVHLKNVLRDAKGKKDRLRWELEQDAYSLLSGNFSLKGETGKAIQYLMESAKRVDLLGDKVQSAIIKGNLGNFHNNMKNYEKGIQLQKAAIEELKSLRKPKSTAVFAGNIAGAYIDSNQPDSALVWGRKTIRLAREQKDAASETAGYYLTGAAYEKKNPDSALYYVNKSIPLAISINNSRILATSYNIKGNIYAEKSNYAEAKKYYSQSISLYKSIGKPIGLHAPLRSLGLEANRFRDYETASKYLSEYITFEDSVVSEDNRKLVHEFNTKYETEKKERLLATQKLTIEKEQNEKRLLTIGALSLLIALLGIFIFYRNNQKVREQKRMQEKENEVLTAFIDGEERERNRMSHELHDGVASMIGVAKMNIETLPHLPEDRQKEQIQKVVQILDNTHSDIRHIAHNLLPATLQKEGLVKAVEQFAAEISQTGILAIAITNHTDEHVTISLQKQLMVFRMIQELINNIIKHSQAEEATIIFQKQNDILTVTITDNGIGFDGEVSKESQGLYSIQQRMSTLGRFLLEKNENGNGIKAVLELDMSKGRPVI